MNNIHEICVVKNQVGSEDINTPYLVFEQNEGKVQLLAKLKSYEFQQRILVNITRFHSKLETQRAKPDVEVLE